MKFKAIRIRPKRQENMRCFMFSILKAALRPLVFDTYPEVIWLKGAILPTRPATTFRIQGYQKLSVYFEIPLNCTKPLLKTTQHTFLYTTISYSQDCHGSPCSCFLQDVKTFACSASPKWNNGQMKWYCLRDYDKLYGLEATPTHYYSEGRCHFKEIEHNISHLSSFICARIGKFFGKFKIHYAPETFKTWS